MISFYLLPIQPDLASIHCNRVSYELLIRLIPCLLSGPRWAFSPNTWPQLHVWTVVCFRGMFRGMLQGMFRRYMALDERDVVSGYASGYALGYVSRGQTRVSGLHGGLL